MKFINPITGELAAARPIVAAIVGEEKAEAVFDALSEVLPIYEDVYEQLSEMIEPHVARGADQAGLPASVVGSMAVLLKHWAAAREAMKKAEKQLEEKQQTPSTIKPRVGGSYLNRQGEVVKIVAYLGVNYLYPFKSDSSQTFTVNGLYDLHKGYDYDLNDLASEVEEHLHKVKLKVGGVYLDRLGNKSEIIVELEDRAPYAPYKFKNSKGICFTSEGKYLEGTPSERDLVSEVTPASKNKPTQPKA